MSENESEISEKELRKKARRELLRSIAEAARTTCLSDVLTATRAYDVLARFDGDQ